MKNISFLVLVLWLMVVAFGCEHKNKSGKFDNSMRKDSASDTKAEAAKPAPDTVRIVPEWNATARYLGGLDVAPESPLAKLTQEPDFQAHKQYFDQAFATKSKVMLDSLTVWAEQELGDVRKTSDKTVFYPFAGADFVTIHTLFPDARHYVLFGLEPEGTIPPIESLAPARRSVNLQNIRTSSDDIMSLSFFKTIDMSSDFRRAELKGTLPLLLAFVARKGNEIINVNHIAVNNSGTVDYTSEKDVQNPDDSIATGYRIKFRKSPDAPIQTIEYFSVNVHDPAFKKNKGFQAYLESLKPTATYIKSASYLLHKPYFSIIHNKIQEVSDVILQDDSGFPIRSFAPEQWKIQYYGVYSEKFRPIPLFANLYQAELTKRYKENTAKPLPFGIGYQYKKGTSNLLRADKVQSVASEQKTTQPKRKAKS
jgi:hypothetical protein